MGFLAFLVIGGLSGAIAWGFYPRQRAVRPKLQKLLIASLLGFLAALASSYTGQWTGFFQAGQMLEWLSAIIAACVAGGLYAALFK
ncbi:hypothetical protein [Polynucleobacter antarcticus]|uniref:Transglycosylase associated protein n=1 Tax=Polynucleobacter antarcticus TaxID=1743162 RepID=A0A6M9PXR7_9BURK|nr:hypothetical protein [Polynucleobacter antarcticus]QKM63555.1 hypothetical protein DCO16_00710 [Polynucleobacter antarcticus]